MSYSDLIDRLVDTRIHEGMLSTLSGKGVTPLLDALESGDIKQIKGSNIKIDTHYFNNSPFSRDLLTYTAKHEELPSVKGRDYSIYHLSYKNNDYIVVFEYDNRGIENNLSRCVIHLCDNKDTVDVIWDYVQRGRLNLFKANDILKGCKIVADTFRIRQSPHLLSSSYKSGTILNNDSDVLSAMFNNSVGYIKSDLGSEYTKFITMLEDTCVNYSVVLKDTTLSINFKFKSKEDCVRIVNYLISKVRSSFFCNFVYFRQDDFLVEFHF